MEEAELELGLSNFTMYQNRPEGQLSVGYFLLSMPFSTPYATYLYIYESGLHLGWLPKTLPKVPQVSIKAIWGREPHA